jgi:ABC-type transport system substrate-binding protein
VGIRVHIRSLSWASFLEAIRRGLAPLFLLAWEADFADASNFLEVLLHSRNIDSNNHFFFAEPRFDALVDEAAATTDAELRLGLLRQAQAVAHEKVPMVPTHYPVIVHAIHPRVRDYRLHALRPPRYDRVGVDG